MRGKPLEKGHKLGHPRPLEVTREFISRREFRTLWFKSMALSGLEREATEKNINEISREDTAVGLVKFMRTLKPDDHAKIGSMILPKEEIIDHQGDTLLGMISQAVKEGREMDAQEIAEKEIEKDDKFKVFEMPRIDRRKRKGKKKKCETSTPSLTPAEEPKTIAS